MYRRAAPPESSSQVKTSCDLRALTCSILATAVSLLLCAGKVEASTVLARSNVAEVPRHTASLLPSGTDLDRDGLDDGVEASLIRTYSPYILFDELESYWPADADWFVEHSNLYHIDRQYPHYDPIRRVCESVLRSEIVVPRSDEANPTRALSTNPLYLLEYVYERPPIGECTPVPFVERTNILCLDAKSEFYLDANGTGEHGRTDLFTN